MAKNFVLFAFLPIANANENGLATTPPMGWRSWNLYGANVEQSLIEGIMDGMVAKKRMVDGVPTSLCDLGYCDVGLDDNWQNCQAGTSGNNYHDDDGNPIINYDRFPDMKNMTDHAHALGLSAGWYGNNCICSDSKSGDRKFYEGDAKALRDFNFDGFKLDGCGAQTDMQLWDDVFKADGGAPVMVENCHWGSKKPYEPTRDWCPWNFYRTSGDVRARFSSVIGNLNSVTKFSDRNLSYPGCWAYPDMLEVGCQHGPGGKGDPGLTAEETRTHFGAWAIVSSPLTLSHDVNNDTIMDQVWDVISNKEAIEVSQTYAGFSGGAFHESSKKVKLDDVNYAAAERDMAEHELLSTGPMITSSHQYLYKPMTWDRTRTAVFLINSDDSAQNLTLNFADVPGLTGPCDVRCIWGKKDLGNFAETFTHEVASHDSGFFMLSGCTSAPLPPPAATNKIVNPASGRCVDIWNNDFSNEAKVQIYDCNSGANQEWSLQGTAIVNPASGKCLDIYNNEGLTPDKYKDETKVELYTCNGKANQQWELVRGQLVNTPSGKCLDIYSPTGSLENLAQLQLFTCGAGKANQQWEIQQEFLV